MTEGNKRRLEIVAVGVANLIKDKSDAQGAALVILSLQNGLNIVLSDLVLRPEMND